MDTQMESNAHETTVQFLQVGSKTYFGRGRDTSFSLRPEISRGSRNKIRITHPRTNYHHYHAFSQGPRRAVLRYHTSGKCIAGVPICSGMGATNFKFWAIDYCHRLFVVFTSRVSSWGNRIGALFLSALSWPNCLTYELDFWYGSWPWP